MDELERKSASENKHADKHSIIIILEDVRSMNNVGSVFRTCDAFAIESIFLCGYTPQPPHRDIQKTALGATESVHWKHFPSTKEAVEHAKSLNYTICAIEQTHNSMLLGDNNISKEKTALIFGNEVNGVNDEILKMSDSVVEIPQWGAKHSLNIAVSVGVVLWEFVRDQVKTT